MEICFVRHKREGHLARWQVPYVLYASNGGMFYSFKRFRFVYSGRLYCFPVFQRFKVIYSMHGRNLTIDLCGIDGDRRLEYHSNRVVRK